MIVVDTNVIVYFYIPGTYSSLCENLFKKDSEWMVPFLWRSEFCNVLALYVRKKLLSNPEAISIMKKVEMQMLDGECDVSSSEVLQLTNISSCSAYDCEYVALAHKLKIPLLTFDSKVLKEFHKTAIHPRVFVS